MDESVKHYTLTLPNDIKAVPQMNSFMESVLPWDGTMLMTIKLALEEAVVNVMNYAYPDNVTGEVTVDVFLEEKGKTAENRDYRRRQAFQSDGDG